MKVAVLVLIVLAVWAFRAYKWPFTQCRRCQGKKTNPGSTRKRYGLCRKCKGSGSRQVLGAKTVHRAVKASKRGFRTWRQR